MLSFDETVATLLLILAAFKGYVFIFSTRGAESLTVILKRERYSFSLCALMRKYIEHIKHYTVIVKITLMSS